MKRDRFFSRMSFRMWISFTLLAGVITLLFWGILSSSVRLTYKNENIEDMDRMIWKAMAQYGSEEFYEQLGLICEGQNYAIEILAEQEQKVLYSSDAEGNSGRDIFDHLLPEQLFRLLDENGGNYSYSIEDSTTNTEWAVQAIVIANVEGYRQVMILGKSLMNVNNMVALFGKRVVYAFFAVLGISSLLSFLITRLFADPIRRLTQKARLLAEGEYNVDFPQEGCYEVRQLSDTLGLAASEFNATEKMRREFVANVSHDMRTPLTIIKMYAEMIQTVSGDNPAKREEHLERIQSEAEKLNGLINDFMELARLQSGTFEVSMKKFNLSNLVKIIVDSFGAHQESEDFEIETFLSEDAYVNADIKLIERAIQNFLSNAIKFSLNEKKITIRVKHCGQTIRTEVQDYGTGIASENLNEIWTRYYKVDPYGNNKTGTGLGLNIVSEIMKLHGAEYGVESELGCGSTFWFELKAVER